MINGYWGVWTGVLIAALYLPVKEEAFTAQQAFICLLFKLLSRPTVITIESNIFQRGTGAFPPASVCHRSGGRSSQDSIWMNIFNKWPPHMKKRRNQINSPSPASWHPQTSRAPSVLLITTEPELSCTSHYYNTLTRLSLQHHMLSWFTVVQHHEVKVVAMLWPR